MGRVTRRASSELRSARDQTVCITHPEPTQHPMHQCWPPGPVCTMSVMSNMCQGNDARAECNKTSAVVVTSKSTTMLPAKGYPSFSVKQTSSGSETDVSTSTENLSPEEHYVLKNSTRQEPQGEETYLTNDCASPLNNNTLIIHENNTLNNSIYSYMSPLFYGQRNIYESIGKDQMTKGDSFVYQSHHQVSDQATCRAHDKNGVLNLKNSVVKIVATDDSPYSNIKYCNSNQTSTPPPNPQLFVNNDSVIKFQSSADTSQANHHSTSAINLQQPMLKDYLDSLKKKDALMMKNFNVDSINLPPPPEYEKPWNAFQLAPNSKSYERLVISRSHPDLSKFPDEEVKSSPGSANNPSHLVSSSLSTTSGRVNRNPSFRRNNNTLDMLMSENSHLRTELDLALRKVQKLQKVDIEIQKIHQSYEELMKTSDKKEKFERDARYKLEVEVRKLQKQNRVLKDELEANLSKKTTNYDDVDSIELKKEITKQNVLISILHSQNKELSGEKERQEIELQAQRLTLQEQRNHIDILDTALMNAQNNIITLESELRKKQGWEEKTVFLKKALNNLQSANERRLQMEKRIRIYLEKENEKLKKQISPDQEQAEINMANDVEALKKNLIEYEKKIISLEAEVSKWEQKYLEESTLRSIEVSAASAPKDAKIAALERTSQESEKLIAEARNERLKHMDEIHQANKKYAEMESKLKDMESKLAEKEAMIKVLQKHSEERDAALQKTMMAYRFPKRHTRSASTMGLVVSSASGMSPSAGKMTTTSSSTAPSTPLKNSAPTTPTGTRSNGSTGSSSTPSTANSLSAISSDCSNSSSTLDDHTKDDSGVSSKDSIIKALRNEKERYPNLYNNWRL